MFSYGQKQKKVTSHRRMFQISSLSSKPDGACLWIKPPKPWFCFAVFLILLTGGCKADQGQQPHSEDPQPPATIFLIRHAEKLTNGEMDLSAAGSERAKLLVQAFSGNRPWLPTPQVLFAAHVSAHSNRSLQTLLPLATSLHLPIDDSFKDEDYEDLAAALLSGKYAGKVVLGGVA